ADAQRELSRLNRRLETEGLIVAEQAGRILELSAAPGDVLEAGDRLGSIETAAPGEDLRGLCFFAVGDGKRLLKGMDIRITPDSVERARYGSIEGRIVSVTPFPITGAEAESVVGNVALAAELVAGGRLIVAQAELLRDAGDPPRFRWTSSKGPPLEVSGGTTANVRVEVE